MPVITKELSFDMGHRLLNHESKCAHVHGHRYTAHVSVQAHSLDSVGRVVDFSVLKERVGRWVDEHLDHAYCGERGDKVLPFLHAQGQKLYVLPYPPTAETLAAWLFVVARKLLARTKGLTVTRVVLFETPTSSATVTSKDVFATLPMFDTEKSLSANGRKNIEEQLAQWIEQTHPSIQVVLSRPIS